MTNKTLNVVHSSPIWLPLTQTWMYTQVKYLPADFNVHIVCDRVENQDQFSLPNIHCLQNESLVEYYWEKSWRKVLFPQNRNFLAKKCSEVGAQLIHSHFGSNGWFDLSAANRSHIKHVVTFYGHDVNSLPSQDKRWLSRYQELFQSADVFLFEGPYMASQVEKLGCPKEKVHVHHLGIPIDNLPFHPREYSPGQVLKVLIAAAFNEKKGIPYAIHALSRIKDLAPIEVTIIGDAGSSDISKAEKRKIYDAISKSNFTGEIRMMGFQPYKVLISESYKNHIFISPSVTATNGDTEGGAPVSIIEMIATGMPVVSTKHCDIPEVIHYGEEGWLVEEKDVDGLVERLIWLIKNPGEWKRITEHGRKHIETEFDAINQGIRLGKIYKKIIQN